MKFLKLHTLALAASLCVAAPLAAQPVTLKVANQGDVVSMDPHTLNEAVQLAFLNNVYEGLVTRDKSLKVVASLATAWRLRAPTVWQFDLREGVKFHGGEAFTADDVVFSLDRARGEGSDVRAQLSTVKEVRKTGPMQIEVETTRPNPILPDVITNILIISKSWAEANQAQRPIDRRRSAESPAALRANGTGPFVLKERQPGVRTSLTRNPNWWNKHETNIDEVIFQPISSDATRVAALISGEVDAIDPVPLQDIPRIQGTVGLKILQAPESRIIFLGFDHAREEVPGASIKGRNPFKDVRVRQAMYQAIDVNLIASRIMRGLARPTGTMIDASIRGFAPDMEPRLPFDADAAKRLLAEAGYPDGFEVPMQCPNDRYVNDAEICQAVAAQLARIGVKVRLATEGKATYFQKGQKREFSFFMLGWSPAGYDAHNLLATVLSTPSPTAGSWNFGAYSNKELDDLTNKILVETNEMQRNAMIKQALAIHNKDIGHIPLHQQMLTWGMKARVEAYQRADGFMLYKWVNVKR
jgi:peptide/nickel transport system substrate-binding protein